MPDIDTTPLAEQPTPTSQHPPPPATTHHLPPTTRRGLGRGLGALIPHGESGTRQIELDRIEPNPQQPRLKADQAALSELAESIREHGLLQPVVVARQEGELERYTVIAGERRWRAARLAGLQTIPAIVREVAAQQRIEIALVENLQREDLTPLEMAAAYRALIDEHGLTQEQVARRIGKGRVAVANTLRLLQLPAPGREALQAGKISEGHARALLGAPDESGLLQTLAEVVRRGLTVRQTEELVRRAGEADEGTRGRGDAETRGRRDWETRGRGEAEIAALEERFRQALGTKVQLVRGRRGGRLIVHFYSDDQLQGIYEAICKE